MAEVKRLGEPVSVVAGIPVRDYPLRLLRAYRHNCDCPWNAEEATRNAEYQDILRENRLLQEQAKVLDQAIAILEEHMNV